jgi:hypothetical protein
MKKNMYDLRSNGTMAEYCTLPSCLHGPLDWEYARARKMHAEVAISLGC